MRRYPDWEVDHDRVVRLHTSTVRGYSRGADHGRRAHERTTGPIPRCCRRRRAGAPTGPNVLVIVLDDLGFAQLGCFGSDIATPNIDALAAGGLRYNRFHVTALCSPTRAAILTGRNHHAVGMGMLPELAVRYEGYNGRIPPSAATLARHLRDNGYSTYAVGKWHLAPRVGVECVGSVRPLAARPRVRTLLRLPRRRHEPVDAGAQGRQPLDRAAA